MTAPGIQLYAMSIRDQMGALSSSTGHAVAEALGAGPELEIHLRELVRRTGFAPRSVQLAVEALVTAGVVTERRSGNRRYLRLAAAESLPVPIRLILEEGAKVPALLRRTLGADPRIERAVIFGSAAAGALSGTSDIDLLVVGTLGLRDLLQLLRPVREELGREVNPVLLSPREFRERRASGDHLLTRVAARPHRDLIGSLAGDTG